MIGQQSVDLSELLKNVEVTADLYASLSSYTPSQQRSAFRMGANYASRLLTAIKDLVRAPPLVIAKTRGIFILLTL